MQYSDRIEELNDDDRKRILLSYYKWVFVIFIVAIICFFYAFHAIQSIYYDRFGEAYNYTYTNKFESDIIMVLCLIGTITIPIAIFVHTYSSYQKKLKVSRKRIRIGTITNIYTDLDEDATCSCIIYLKDAPYGIPTSFLWKRDFFIGNNIALYSLVTEENCYKYELLKKDD